MHRLGQLSFLLLLLNYYGCVSFGPSEDKRYGYQEIFECPADSPDDLEMNIKVTDYSVKAAIESADMEFYTRYGINDRSSQNYVKTKVGSICFNEDGTYTVETGIDPDSYDKFQLEVSNDKKVALGKKK